MKNLQKSAVLKLPPPPFLNAFQPAQLLPHFSYSCSIQLTMLLSPNSLKHLLANPLIKGNLKSTCYHQD